MRRTIGAAAAAIAGLLVSVSLALPGSAVTEGVDFAGDTLPTWQTNGIVWALAQSGDTVFAGGTFSEIRPGGVPRDTPGTETANLVALGAATGSPTGCTLPVTGPSASVRALGVSPDGATLYVAGEFAQVDGVYRSRIAAVDVATCTVKQSFVPPAISARVRGLAVTDTAVYLAGEFVTVGGQTRNQFAALHPQTGALLTWAPSADAIGKAVAVTPDGGRVVIGGDFSTVNAEASRGLAVVDAVTGATVRAYGSSFIPSRTTIQTITIDSSGIYAGAEGTGTGVFDGRLSLDLDTLDQRWRDLCLGATQDVQPFKGVLYAAHHTHDCSATVGGYPDGPRQHLTAQKTSDASIYSWFPDTSGGIGEGLGPRVMEVATVGSVNYLWIGGEFTQVNSVGQQSLTRFTDAVDTSPPWVVANVTAESVIPGQIQVRWRSSVDPDDDTFLYQVYRDGGNTPVWTGTSKATKFFRPQVSFTDHVTPGSTHSYRVTASDGRNVSGRSPAVSATAVTAADLTNAYAWQVKEDGAELFWRGEELAGPVGADSVGDRAPIYFNDASQDFTTAGALVGEGSGTAVTFSGANGSYAYSDVRTPAPTTYTVEAWVRTNTTRGGKIAGFGDGVPNRWPNNRLSNNYDRHLYLRDNGRVLFGVYTGTTSTIQSDAAINDNQWHHVVAAQGPDGMRLYVDGVLQGQNSVTGSQSYDGSWRIGGDNLSGWPNRPRSNFLAGSIDEFAVYPTSLTAEQVLSHYRLGTIEGEPGPEPEEDVTAPSVPAHLTAVADGDDVDLAWDAATDDVGVVGYDVHRSTDSTFSPSEATRLVRVTGTTYRDVDLALGTFSYRVVAVDAAGNATASDVRSVTLVPAEGQPQTVVLSPTRDTYVNQGAPSANYGPSTSLASRGSSGYTAYLAFSIPETPEGYFLDSASFRLRTTTDPLASSADAHVVRAATSNDWTAGGLTWTNRPALASATLGTLAAGATVSTTYDLALDAQRFAALGAGEQTLAVTSSGTDNLWFFSADHANVSYRPQLTLVFEPGSAPEPVDTEAPSVPGGLETSVAGSPGAGDVTLTWSASTDDDSAIAGYTVHRGTSASVAATAQTKVTDVTVPTWTDENRPAGSWFYVVTALDTAGNRSAASAAAEAVVAAEPDPDPDPEPVTVTLSPVADTYTNQGAASTNYGSSQSLASRGTSGYRSYLAFELPDAPEGTTLEAATLRIRTTNEAIASSADSHAVRLGPDAGWTESALTWASQGALGTSVLGTLPGGATVSTVYEITLTPAALADVLGATVTLQITSTGTDNLWFFSRNAAASLRPALSLTFAP